MGVSTQASGSDVVIKISGNFDISCYDDFNKAIMENLATAKKFAVDLNETSYMDSSALGMLLLLREKTASTSAEVEFMNVSEDVMKILQVAKFDQLFKIS